MSSLNLMTPDDIFGESHESPLESSAPRRPVRPNANQISRSLTRDVTPPSRDVTQNDNDITLCNPLFKDDANIYEAPYKADSRSATLDSVENVHYAEADISLNEIRSDGDLGSVLNLAAPAPNQYDNVGQQPRPARPPRPSRPSSRPPPS